MIVDKDTYDLQYFVEVNTKDDKMITIDYTSNGEKNIFPLDTFFKAQNIQSVDSFSFLNFVGSTNSARILKRKFWGKECGDCNETLYTIRCQHYAFWLENGHSWEGC